MTAKSLLHDLSQRGIHLYVRQGRLRYDAPPNSITQADRSALSQYKADIMKLWLEEMQARFPTSPEGAKLLSPFLPVIQAAHQGELPKVNIIQGGQSFDLSDYICEVSAGIWYGLTLSNPLLPSWLENLRRLQSLYENRQAGCSTRGNI